MREQAAVQELPIIPSWLVRWKQPLIQAALITGLILGLFYYWFAIADRYQIFLYGHSATGISEAQPFDEMTSSRYWMAGLVADGFVAVLYVVTNWLWGRLAVWRKKTFTPIQWWQVWALCVIPISLGIPAITMTVNSPVLPPGLAAACVLATLFGLAVALLPGRWAADRPGDLTWLLMDGAGLIPLLLLKAFELPGRLASVSTQEAWFYAIAGTLAALIWLAVMTVLRLWRHRKPPSAMALLAAWLGICYLFLPLVHYVLMTPADTHYISTASNFFTFGLATQLLITGAAVVMASVITKARWWVWERTQKRQ